MADVNDLNPVPDEAELERLRQYLAHLARIEFDPRLRQKLDPSDIVQQTLMEAYSDWSKFAGNKEERLHWLRRILSNNLLDAIRSFRTQGRDVAKEKQLAEPIDKSNARLEQFIAADQTTPTSRLRKEETNLELALALTKIPEPQRDAIVLQKWHGYSLQQIADHMGKTPQAIAALLYRATTNLRSVLDGRE